MTDTPSEQAPVRDARLCGAGYVDMGYIGDIRVARITLEPYPQDPDQTPVRVVIPETLAGFVAMSLNHGFRHPDDDAHPRQKRCDYSWGFGGLPCRRPAVLQVRREICETEQTRYRCLEHAADDFTPRVEGVWDDAAGEYVGIRRRR